MTRASRRKWTAGGLVVDAATTRLVTRVRFRAEQTLGGRAASEAMSVAALVMTRKMLLNIARRAEALARRRRATTPLLDQ